VYVLIGGKTFSAGSAFALNAKNDPKITLVGEETGGGYYFHTGQFPLLYELPNSKIMFSLSLVKINHFVKDTSVQKGNGILPDIEINLTQKDLISGTDSQLDFVIKQIKNN
jgi:C-terminal processing protease CtpA/Prc